MCLRIYIITAILLDSIVKRVSSVVVLSVAMKGNLGVRHMSHISKRSNKCKRETINQT